MSSILIYWSASIDCTNESCSASIACNFSDVPSSIISDKEESFALI